MQLASPATKEFDYTWVNNGSIAHQTITIDASTTIPRALHYLVSKS
ncbi:MAG: hypothetical protein ACTHZ1_10285 [Sphingobacterium sp.]